jgi:FixJ family two-component response regulator
MRHRTEDGGRPFAEKFATLTPREQGRSSACVTGGLLNKQVAAAIGITENTVKVHQRQRHAEDGGNVNPLSWCGWRTSLGVRRQTS